jgi:hypothetical protein
MTMRVTGVQTCALPIYMENDKSVLASHRFTLGYHRIGMLTDANIHSNSLRRSQQCRTSQTLSVDHGKYLP